VSPDMASSCSNRDWTEPGDPSRLRSLTLSLAPDLALGSRHRISPRRLPSDMPSQADPCAATCMLDASASPGVQSSRVTRFSAEVRESRKCERPLATK
jgi:hypothetical protein